MLRQSRHLPIPSPSASADQPSPPGPDGAAALGLGPPRPHFRRCPRTRPAESAHGRQDEVQVAGHARHHSELLEVGKRDAHFGVRALRLRRQGDPAHCGHHLQPRWKEQGKRAAEVRVRQGRHHQVVRPPGAGRAPADLLDRSAAGIDRLVQLDLGEQLELPGPEEVDARRQGDQRLERRLHRGRHVHGCGLHLHWQFPPQAAALQQEHVRHGELQQVPREANRDHRVPPDGLRRLPPT